MRDWLCKSETAIQKKKRKMFEQHILSCRRRKNTKKVFVGCIQKDLAVQERKKEWQKNRVRVYIETSSIFEGGWVLGGPLQKSLSLVAEEEQWNIY